MTDALQTPGASDCLGRTCMKWGSDGELAALDLCLVLEPFRSGSRFLGWYHSEKEVP
jgi:hypothetical protein